LAAEAEKLFRRSFTLNRLGHSAGPDATRAQADLANAAIRALVTHTLQIRLKAALGFNIGVTHIVAALGNFTAIFAFLGHGLFSFSCKSKRLSYAPQSKKATTFFHFT